MLQQLVYCSKAVHLMDSSELLQLLANARQFNHSVGITGMLLYKDQSFIQMLEGDEQQVESLYARIQQDSRHYRVKTLYQQPAQQRAFSNWSMGFQNLHLPPAENFEGYSAFMSPEYDVDALLTAPQKALKLLLYFRSYS